MNVCDSLSCHARVRRMCEEHERRRMQVLRCGSRPGVWEVYFAAAVHVLA